MFHRLFRASVVFLVLDAAATEIYTLSLHDALPISCVANRWLLQWPAQTKLDRTSGPAIDRKSTRLNSSHRCISYAVFCLKKKNKTKEDGDGVDWDGRCRHYAPCRS